MSDIIIVHGAYTHGRGIDKLAIKLRASGYTVREYEFPKRYALMLYLPWVYRKDGATLANFMNEGDHIVAHSYGCAIWQQSILTGAKWGKCFLFGGACTSDKFLYPDDSLEEAWVVYNPEDWVLWLGSKLPFHIFGLLGYHGFAGQPDSRKKKDPKFHNTRGFKDKGWRRHTHYFIDERLDKWRQFIVDKLK
ncbi:MAG: hypothetical protein GY820_39260 [Gammaproteobacteria bacterium]|nr:hypothetical protein [Gammaproteobacteria bacterium]